MERNSRERDKRELDDLEQAEFERQVRFAMQRRPAPVGLKQRVLARARERRLARHGRLWMWQRVAAVVVLAAVVGGFGLYEQSQKRAEERRKGEAAREQVMLALRITHKTLDRVGERLAEGGR